MNPHTPSAERLNFLVTLQLFLCAILAAVCAYSVPRLVLFEYGQAIFTPLDFRAITLSVPDFVMATLLMATFMRLLTSKPYRAQLNHAFEHLLGAGLLPFILLLIYAFVGVFLWARDPLLARFDALHMASALAAALIMADLHRQGVARWLVMGLVVGASAQTMIALLQVLRQDAIGLAWLGELPKSAFAYDPYSFYRPPALTMHSNYFGGYVMVAFLVCAYTAFRTKGRYAYLWWAIGALCGVGLLASLSRGAMLSAGFGLLPLAFLWAKQSGQMRRLLMISLALAISAGGALMVITRGDLLSRVFAPREFFFADSWQVTQTAPLTGVGAGNLGMAITSLYPPNSVPIMPYLPVHNVYFFILAELGLIGLALFSLSLMLMIRSAGVWFGLYLAIICLMLFDNYLWAVHPFRILLMLVFAFSWGSYLLNKPPTES
jgi:O-antigen ligase